ncbi:MAG: GTP-binding protein [Candidatus Baldrarchaeia archaeon]
MPRVDPQGRLHFKIVFWGPSLSGKTTSLRWIYNNVEGITKGRFVSIEDPTGRTLYFDYTPVSISSKVVFDLYTVAGQRRHKIQRRKVLEGVDGILFVADSDPAQLQENEISMTELRQLLGDKLGREIPLVVLLNKRDLPNAVSKETLLNALKIVPVNIRVYEGIAIRGIGVKQAFKAIVREVLWNYYQRAKQQKAQ